MVSFRHKSASDYATAAIRQMILTGELPPGARVDQNEMAKQLDLSRHPVRQAIERLAERGFVQSRPHRSVIVSDLSADDMQQLYDARQVLEDMAIRLAWPRYDAAFLAAQEKLIKAMERARDIDDLDDFMVQNAEFHMGFYRPCGNVHLIRVIDTLFQLSERYQRTALMVKARSTTSADEHRAMLDVIRSGDVDTLIATCSAHNTGTMQTVKSALERR